MTASSLSSEVLDAHPFIDELCLAAAHDFTLLATLHNKELDARTAAEIRALQFPMSLGLHLKQDRATEIQEMLLQDIQGWPRDLPETLLQELAADYASIYLNNYCSASPQESFWIDEDHLAWQEPMFQVRKLYQRFDLAVENWRERADDHLVTQLQFIAYLLSLENAPEHLETIATFLDEHLLRWLNSFATRVASRCETPFYGGLALLTDFYTETFRDLLAAVLDQPRPTQEQIDARMKPERIEAVPVKFIPGAEASW